MNPVVGSKNIKDKSATWLHHITWQPISRVRVWEHVESRDRLFPLWSAIKLKNTCSVWHVRSTFFLQRAQLTQTSPPDPGPAPTPAPARDTGGHRTCHMSSMSMSSSSDSVSARRRTICWDQRSLKGAK